jgi:hypothetical protein
MTEYMSTILHLVRNEKTKSEDRPFEVPFMETPENDLKEGIETVNEPEVTEVAVDEAPVQTLDDVEGIAKMRTKETTAPVEPINKDSEEYQKRIKDSSNNYLASAGVLNKICGFYVGYEIVDCKFEVKVKLSGCPQKK